MAHAATLNGLAGDLVTAITGKPKDDASFARIREKTLKGFRDQNHARTNQFAIKSKLDGMVEKFEVLNREDLANAFQTRLDELPQKSRWMPEILSFLLELSDRPTEKTNLEDVEQANGPVLTEKDLTWDDILAEDPLSDSEVWENVERGYFSSGDDSFEDDSDPTLSTQATSLDDEDVAAAARLHLVQHDETLLAAVKETRDSWKPVQSRDSSMLSEITVVRDIIFMLRGLPTDLFYTDPASGRVSLARRATMVTASSHSLYDVLNICVKTGTIINYLRRWVASPQDTPYLQSIQSAMNGCCVQFGNQLGEIEQRFVASDAEAVVSVMQVQAEIQRAGDVLIRLATIVRNASVDKSPFALLDILYDETILGELTVSTGTYQTLSSILLAGLRTYLRPVAAWIKTGSLASKHSEDFFVLDSNFNCELGQFWNAAFSLRCLPDGTPIAPKCFQAFARKTFALGKSRALLKRLNQESEETFGEPATTPSFQNLSLRLHQDTFMPFTQLLHETLESWITEVSTDCTPQLQSALLYEHGLMKTLTALPYVYFARDGIALATFADALIARVPGVVSKTTSWSDQFLLTELAHNIFGAIAGVDVDSVLVSTIPDEESNTTRLSSTLTTVQRLEEVNIKYNLPWQVQNVTRSSTLPHHNKAFVLLLQVYYASSSIQGRFFDLRSGEANTSVAFRVTLKLRQHLLCFASLIQAYLATTALTLHQDMQARMAAAEDIDAMTAVWSDHERRLGTSLLLTERLGPIRDAVLRILELSELLRNTTGVRGVTGLLEQYQRGMAFLVAGVRGISRAGGEPSLEMLAERLESVG